MSDAVYRCKSCKTRVTMAMTICPICGEPISPHTALLSSGSSVPTHAPAQVATRHNSASAASFATVTTSYAAPKSAPQPAPPPQPTPVQSATLQQMWDEMATPQTPTSASVANMAAYPFPTPPAKARNANRSFALYVACVVMVLVGSFLIGIGLARRYTASEQALQNAAAPARVIVVQPSAGVGGPLPTEAEDLSK